MTTEEAIDLLREARAAVGDYDCADCGIRDEPVWGRIDAALASHKSEVEQRKAHLDRVWWDAMAAAGREGLDASESARRADAAVQREQRAARSVE